MRFASFESDPNSAVLNVIRPLYAEIYAEDPYCEGPSDVADFAENWPGRTCQPGFRAVIAEDEIGAIGFTFGHRLSPDTRWWEGLRDPINNQVTAEWPGRTFAIIEMAVRASNRRQGIGAQLHATLLDSRTEQRVTLLCRPEASAAQAAYTNWGYQPIGRLQPFRDGPTYVAMIRNLPL